MEQPGAQWHFARPQYALCQKHNATHNQGSIVLLNGTLLILLGEVETKLYRQNVFQFAFLHIADCGLYNERQLEKIFQENSHVTF